MIALRTVVLVGVPGSGKTSTGIELAHLLELESHDVDALIEAEHGRSIAEIFATDGESAFRALEEAATLRALQAGGVVALGGGAVTNPVIREALGGHVVVWLRATLNQAVHRVGDGTRRPLLASDPAGRLGELMRARTPHYEAVSTHAVDTDGLRPRAVAHLIADQLTADLTPPEPSK